MHSGTATDSDWLQLRLVGTRIKAPSTAARSVQQSQVGPNLVVVRKMGCISF